jgi:hypothetical protein
MFLLWLAYVIVFGISHTPLSMTRDAQFFRKADDRQAEKLRQRAAQHEPAMIKQVAAYLVAAESHADQNIAFFTAIA